MHTLCAVTRSSAVAERPRAIRVIEHFAKSLEVIIEMTLLSRACIPISIPLKLCLYLVPFLRYSASKNGVTLKPGLGVVQGH